MCLPKSRLTENDKNIIEAPKISNEGTTTDVTSSGKILKSNAVVIEDPTHSGTTGSRQDISQFLEKPFLVTTLNFGVSNLRNDVLYSSDVLPLIKSNPVWMNKIAGSGNIRATVVITVQVNSSPYNAGGLLLHFLPNYTHSVNMYQTRNSLRTRSQQPGIRMDIVTDKELTIEIPYCAPTYYCNMSSGLFDWGRFFLTVWSPFTSGAASPTSCSVSIWMHLRDVELANPIVAQSGVRKGQRGSVVAYKGVHPSEQERGPVSKVLSATSTIASTLATIPSLTTLAGPVAWFTNVAAGVASSFGWSKPLNDNFGGRMIKGPNFGAPNCNGLDQSQPLGLFADNKVRVMTGLGNDGEDQMSINYLKSRTSYGGSFTLSYSDTQTTVFSTQLYPYSFDLTTSGGVNGTTQIYVQQLTTIGFLAKLFTLWRGGITVRFHFHKTQFHTGRILIAFAAEGGIPTLASSAYLHRAIIDLSEGNEVCLTFPYTLVQDYITTDDSIGSFSVIVLNPLRGPDSVASSIDVTMEVCGAADMEFQIPRNGPLNPIVAQAGGDEEAPDNLLCQNIGGSTVPQNISGSSQYCVGEHVTSLLQLCKRYTRWAIPASMWTASGVVRIAPFVTQAYQMVASTGVLTNPTVGGDYIDLISGLYTYQRGGVRFRIMSAVSSNAWSTWIESSIRGNLTCNIVANEGQPNQRQAYVSKFVQPGSEGGLSVQIPAYGKYYTRLCRYTRATDDLYAPDTPPVCLAIESIGGPGANPSTIMVSRAAADDFQFSNFIGVPDMTTQFYGINS